MANPLSRHFDTTAFNTFIDFHGVECTWNKAVPCPCRDAATDAPSPTCELCAGDGVYYYDPTTITVNLLSLNFDKKYQLLGALDEVLINATFTNDVWVSDGDRITPTDEIIVDSELFTRGDETFDGTTKERLIYRYPVELLTVLDANGVSYTVGTDVTLVNDPLGYARQLAWPGSHPATGVRYVVRYRTRAEFIVFLSQPRIRIEGGNKQLSFCRLRRVTAFRKVNQ